MNVIFDVFGLVLVVFIGVFVVVLVMCNVVGCVGIVVMVVL